MKILSSNRIYNDVNAGLFTHQMARITSIYYIGYEVGGTWHKCRAGYADKAGGLGAYAEKDFLRKNENATITGNYTFNNKINFGKNGGLLQGSAEDYAHITIETRAGADAGGDVIIKTASGSLYNGALKVYAKGEFSKDVTILGNVTAANLNITSWNTAYGWGDHSKQGYLTSETDPAFTNHIVSSIEDGYGFLKKEEAGSWVWDNSTYSESTHDHDDSYLLKNGKAADSLKFDGLGADSFLRSDIEGTALKIMTFESGIELKGKLYLSSGEVIQSGILYPNTIIPYNGANGRSIYNTHFSEITTGGYEFRTSGNIKLLIRGDGKIGIGTNSPSEALDVNGNGLFSGNITAGGDITPSTASDFRLKRNIQSNKNALSVINKLRPVTFNWNKKAKELNTNKDDRLNYGFVAQELETACPNLINSIYGDKYKSIDYMQIISINTRGIQELHSIIKQQECRIKQLESRLK